MGSLIPLTRNTQLAPRRPHPLATSPRQLDLVLDDARLRGLTKEDRNTALQSLAHLLLEAAGMAMREVGDDHE
jgi:hypothetical protein